MSSIGPLSPGTMADDASVGTVAFSNPDNAKVSDNVYATNDGSVGGTVGGAFYSHYLKATNFGFSIPAGATINGILVEIQNRWDSGYYEKDNVVKIVKADGTIGTTNKASATSWSHTPAYFSYGSSTDLWGETWTPTNINDVDFGVVLSTLGAYASPPSLNENSLISTANGYVKIKDIKVGNKVVSYNEITKKTELKTVEAVVSHPISDAHNRYFYLYVNGQIVEVTENHKFYLNGVYVRADELKVGDKLLGFDLKEYPIEKIEVIENTTDLVWDLTVRDNHNFFANYILVHNASVDHIRVTVTYTEVSGATMTGVSTMTGVQSITL